MKNIALADAYYFLFFPFFTSISSVYLISYQNVIKLLHFIAILFLLSIDLLRLHFQNILITVRSCYTDEFSMISEVKTNENKTQNKNDSFQQISVCVVFDLNKLLRNRYFKYLPMKMWYFLDVLPFYYCRQTIKDFSRSKWTVFICGTL